MEVKEARKDIEWGELGFKYIKTNKSYVTTWRGGAWDEGGLTDDEYVRIHESSAVFQYSQTCFEGLKAYRTADGHIQLFRPDLNDARMHDTCEGLLMPPLPEGRFIEAVDSLVRANTEFVPPYGTGASMYIRPFMIGSGPVIAVVPAEEFMFRIYCTPVGPYFKGGMKSMRLMVSDYDRAAPRGTGHVKAGLNYAMSLYPCKLSKKQGFDDTLFLDAATHTYVEEASGANIVFVTKDGRMVTPKSGAILPSITRRSLFTVAEIMGVEIEEREIAFAEVPEFVECALCGTAAVMSGVGSITRGGREIKFRDSADEMGPVCRKVRERLVSIQNGDAEAPDGWIHRVI